MQTLIHQPRRTLAALAVLATAALATPTVAAAPAQLPSESAQDAPLGAPVQARYGEFVEATDTALVLTQPDGSELRARMTEAEIGGALELDGYSIVKGDDGWWRYASARGARGLEAGHQRAGVDKRPAGLEPGVGRIAPVWDDGRGGDVRTQLLRQLQIASRQASAKAAAGGGPRVFRFPVVLFATWSDTELGQTSPQFQEGNTVEHYKAILDGFGGNPTGTLTEFYFENSYGQFLVQVDVLAQPNGDPYVSTRSLEDRCYYGGIDAPEDPSDDLDPLDSAIGVGGGGALGMAVELFNTTTLPVDHAFDVYDNDGDNSIDFMGIVHSGAEMAVTGDPCNTWSHAISVSTFTSIAGEVLQDFGLPVPATGFKAGLPVPGQAVTYDRLFTMPEFETRNGILTIGVAAHEMAHALGEPDYYGTDGSSSGSGDWDIMSGGSYGGTPSGSNPTWFNPATRVFQGWVKPTLVHEDELDYTLERRSSMPEGYTVAEANPNLVMVPTRWVKEGDETSDGHVWVENDLYGLVEDGDNGFVIEGWYLELASRMPTKAPGIHSDMTRESYFDRWLYGSGLLTWHFDYWRRSNVYFGQNGANNDPNRMQMDVEEWDFNDNTQEIALNRNRAEASDVAWEAATGITSATHRPNPNIADPGDVGDPQAEIPIPSGPTTPVTPYDFAFEVDDTPANHTMTVVIVSDLAGDCTLQLLSGEEGSETEETEVIDPGSFGAAETAIITDPKPGRWVARIGDFAACGSASGAITFEGPSGFDATGTADTWSNEEESPTGWAFTNIRTGGAEGLSHGTDAGGPGTLTVDILNLDGTADVSPGFARPAFATVDGRGPVVAGQDNPFEVPVFSNGSQGVESVAVQVREGSPSGPLVASGLVSAPPYDSAVFEFDFDPGHEGAYDLYTIVDPAGDVEESVEDNNVQKVSGWAGPANPSVLIVDDDGPGDTERVYAGALAALGIPYAIAEKHADDKLMEEYDAVIWVSTLDRGDGQLDEDNRTEIASYLGNGGKLWLSSNRAIEALALSDSTAFGANWFGVESVDIDSFYKPVQFETGDILGDDGLSIELLPGRPFVDKYELSADAFGEVTSLGVLQGSGTPAAPGDGVAILAARLEGGGEQGDFQTVVNSFNLSQVGEPADAVAMVEAIMDNFGVLADQYTVVSDDPIVYHAQPRQTVANVDLPVRAVVLGGDAGQPVRLSYRHHGIGDYVVLDMVASGDDGGYLVKIPAVDVTPDGIDYYLKAGANSTYEPRIAQGGDVASAIAVFMPDAAAAPTPTPTPTATPSPRVEATATRSPTPMPSVDGSDRLPATGGEALTALGAALLLGGLLVQRLQRRATS